MSNILIFIESNTTGTGMAILKRTTELGFTPIFVTNKPERYLGLESFTGLVITCDTNNLEGIKQNIAQFINPIDICGITTTSEFYVETVAHLAAHYGVLGNSSQAVTTCRNKNQTRHVLQDAGVEQPKFKYVANLKDVTEAVKFIGGFPCVVKPTDDTGSYAVSLCYTIDEVQEQVTSILAMDTNVRGQKASQAALIEAYLDFPEYSVEMFSWHGQTICVGITEKHLLPPPKFVEYQHIFPAPLSESVADNIAQVVSESLLAVGYQYGPSHTEIKLTNRGPAVVEINARLAGGMIPALIKLVTKVDLLEQQCRVAMGQKPSLEHDIEGLAGIRFLVSNRDGIFQHVSGLVDAQRLPGVATVNVTAKPGKRVKVAESAYDRLGYIIVHGKSYQEVIDLLDKVDNSLSIHID